MLKKILISLLVLFFVNSVFADARIISKEERCRAAENNLTVLKNKQNIYRRDEFGNLRKLSYFEIYEEIKNNEQFIQEVCLSPKLQITTRAKDSVQKTVEQAILDLDENALELYFQEGLSTFDKKTEELILEAVRRKDKTKALQLLKGENSNSYTNVGNSYKQELIYEDAPYHSAYGSGNKSPKPTNGKEVLNNSVPVKNTSKQRVGVDKTTGEYVVFNRTDKGTYHGHIRNWKGNNSEALTQEMKNALEKAGIINKKDKILK